MKASVIYGNFTAPWARALLIKLSANPRPTVNTCNTQHRCCLRIFRDFSGFFLDISGFLFCWFCSLVFACLLLCFNGALRLRKKFQESKRMYANVFWIKKVHNKNIKTFILFFNFPFSWFEYHLHNLLNGPIYERFMNALTALPGRKNLNLLSQKYTPKINTQYSNLFIFSFLL